MASEPPGSAKRSVMFPDVVCYVLRSLDVFQDVFQDECRVISIRISTAFLPLHLGGPVEQSAEPPLTPYAGHGCSAGARMKT